jgi:hypothetical protein
MSDKDFKVKNKLQVKGITTAGPITADSSGNIDSVPHIATQFGGTGTTTSPTTGQIPYSTSGTTYTPTALNTLDVKGSSYSADAPSNPVVGQIWVESDTTSDSFDPNIIRRKSFTATAAQTVFTTDLEFIQGYEQVFFNGMLLLRNSDYTTASNTNVTLTSGAAAGDIVEVVTVTNLNSVNTYTQGEIDTALSAKLSTSTAASTYLTQNNYMAAGKNAIINGGFDIWQRGTSAAMGGSGNTYLADRWASYSASNGTISRQVTGDTTNLPNIQYCARVQRTSGETVTGLQLYGQSLETVNSIPFVGKTVTFSFYARRGENFSAASNVLSGFVRMGTGTDQSNTSAGFTGVSTVITVSATLTTTWQRFTGTATVPTTATQIGIDFRYSATGTAGAADFYEVTGVQLELESVATPFSRAGGTYQAELAACQRYFYGWNSQNNYAPVGIGQCISTTQAQVFASFPVPMRVTPNLSFGTLASLALRTSNGGQNAVTAMAADSQQTLGQLLLVTVASGLSAGNSTSLGRNAAGAGANIYWSAEL